MDDTTAQTGLETGSVDAVAESLIEAPPKRAAKPPAEELPQSDEDNTLELEVDDDVDADEGEPLEADDDQNETDAEDSDESDGADEDEPAERLFTVKVDGRDQQVPLAELLRGYVGQATIQQRFQQVASAKKEVENVYVALQQEREQIARFVQQVQSGDMPLTPPREPDEALMQTDPFGYMQDMAAYNKKLQAYQNAMAAAQELQLRNEEATKRAREAHLADQYRQLAQKIPAFADKAKATQVKQLLVDVGREAYGYTPEELQGVTDARAIQVLYDAARYRLMMKGRTAKVEPKPQAPQVAPLRPGTKVAAVQGKVAKADKARAQMRKTGDVDDVAKFLLM